MWRNPQFSADLVTFAEEALNRKFHFLYSLKSLIIDIKPWFTSCELNLHWSTANCQNFMTMVIGLLYLLNINGNLKSDHENSLQVSTFCKKELILDMKVKEAFYNYHQMKLSLQTHHVDSTWSVCIVCLI